MDNRNNMLQLCRLCLVKDDVNIPIFEEHGDIRQIFLKISSCLPIKVSREDKLPKKICDGCSFKLDTLYEFWNTSANAEKQLLTWLGEAGMNSQTVDGTISAVAQQIKPTDAFVKQETIDPPDIHTEDNDDDKDYMFQQKFEESASAGPSATVTSNEEEEPPPPKRARRTAAVKAAIAMDHDSDDDDDSGEPMTKVEDESEDSEGEDQEPSFADAPSTSADDQPGPSGVGKDGVEAPNYQEHSNDRQKNDPKIQTKKILPNLQMHFPKNRKISKSTKKSKTHFQKSEHPRKKRLESVDRKRNKESKKEQLNETLYKEKIICSEENNGEINKKSCNEGVPRKKQRELKYPRRTALEVMELDKPVSCSLCTESFKTNVDFALHSQTHRPSGDFLCHLCNRVLKIKYQVENHIRNHEDCKKYNCLVCGKSYNSKVRAIRHENTHKGIYPHQCEVCGKCFDLSRSLKVHKFRLHNNKGPAKENGMAEESAKEDGAKRYECKECNISYKSPSSLLKHSRMKHDPNLVPVLCDLCGKTFPTNERLIKHRRTHEEKTRYPCEICSKAFTYTYGLSQHMRIHTGEKPFVCKFCGKAFKQSSPYRYHIMSHTGVKPHVCNVCGKGFIAKSACRNHTRTCTGPCGDNVIKDRVSCE